MQIFLSIIAILFIAFIAYSFLMYRKMKKSPGVAESDKIKILNDQNFNQQIKSGVVIVDFWASWCMPCKMMAPVLNEIAEELDGKVTVSKLNVEHNRQIPSKFNVRNIPTLIIFKNGKEMKRIVGVKPKDYIIKQTTQL